MSEAVDCAAGQRYPTVGRAVVVGSALLLISLNLFTAVEHRSVNLFVTGFAVCGLLSAELFWGSKWARWVVGALMLFWSIQGLLLWWSEYYWWFHFVHVLECVLGGMLLFHRQVAAYLEIRRTDTAARFRRLKIFVRLGFFIIMAAVVFVDVWGVVRSSA